MAARPAGDRLAANARSGAGGGSERAKNLRGAVGGARRPAAGAGLLSWLAA